VHAAPLVPHVIAILAVGRGIFIWLFFRTLAHTVGWPITIAIVAAVAIGAMYAKRARS
jgi:hypothetical protein